MKFATVLTIHVSVSLRAAQSLEICFLLMMDRMLALGR